MKKSLFFIALILSVNFGHAQIDIRKIATRAKLRGVAINRIDKLEMLAIESDRLIQGDVQSYRYHGIHGQEGSRNYYERNQINLLSADDQQLFVIYGSGYRKKLSHSRNCYYGAHIDNLTQTAELVDLYEEDLIPLGELNLFKVYDEAQMGVSHHQVQVLLSTDPPLLFFRSHYPLPGSPTAGRSFVFAFELYIASSIQEIYHVLSLDFKSHAFNRDFLHYLEGQMMSELISIESQMQRGEFETSTDFENRLKELTVHRNQTKQAQEALLSKLKAMIKEDVALRVQRSKQEIFLTIEDIGQYDADNQMFPVRILGITKNVFIPIDEAPGFKNSKSRIKVLADSQLASDSDDIVYTNIRIVHPTDGRMIQF